MKRIKILYPLLFVLGFLVTIDIPQSVVPVVYGIALILVVIMLWGVYRLTQDWHRAGFLVLLATAWLLYYGTAASIIAPYFGFADIATATLVLLLPWTLFFLLLGSRWFWRKFASSPSIVDYLNLVTGAMLLYYGYHAVRLELHPHVASLGTSQAGLGEYSPVVTLPDMYYIILDGYSRADTLDEIYAFDNSDFVGFLENRGFYVAGQSRSNYTSTELSLASSLNMSYLEPLRTGRLTRASTFGSLISESHVRSVVESHGYQFVAFSTPFYFTNISDADVFLSQKPDRSLVTFLAGQLMPRTVAAFPFWAGLISPSGEIYRDQQERVTFMFDELAKLSVRPGPKFVFAHFIAPHPPYVFDGNGPITPDKPYIHGVRTAEEEMDGYLGQLAYLNTLVEQMIATILEKSTSSPVIIIQGDHGAGHSCLKMRTAILNAYHLPELGERSLYDAITPVNSFRIIFNQYFGTDFELLTDKVYSSGTIDHYQYADVTEISSQPCVRP